MYIDTTTQPEERVAKTLDGLTRVMATEGEHYKVWCIDQAVRVLTGGGYSDFVKQFEEEIGSKWDIGIEA